MKRNILLLTMFMCTFSYMSIAQSKPAHPAQFHSYLGKNAAWIDREVRASYDLKIEKKKISKDSARLVVYNALSDIQITFYMVDDVCDYISFDDYSLERNGVKTFFTQWCSDVTDHYKFIADEKNVFPMYMDPENDVVFFIPEDQTLEYGLRYFLFSGFIRDSQLLTRS